MQTLHLSHGAVSYRHAGNGEPVLLLHGWGGSSRYWHTTLHALADSYRLYAPDLPGYGASPPLPDNISSERMAAVVLDYADHLGLSRFHLVAHSFGGSIAAALAATAPARVKQLVLTCYSTFRNESERRMIDQMLRSMGLSIALWQPWMSFWHPWMGLWQSWMTNWNPATAGHVPSIYQTIAWRFFYRMPSDDALLAASFADFLQMDQRTSLESIISALDPTITHHLRHISAPTLVIGARQDMIMPPAGVPVVAEHIPNSRLEWIDHCGHMPMIEQPDVYEGLLRGFLAESTPAPRPQDMQSE